MADAKTTDGGAHDRLRGLEKRIEQASAAAERLIAEAAGAALGRPPAAGWQSPAASDPEAEAAGGATEIGLLVETIRSLRNRIPPDLQHRLGEALRELLLALRALIDWYIERTERERREPSEVQDIPIL